MLVEETNLVSLINFFICPQTIYPPNGYTVQQKIKSDGMHVQLLNPGGICEINL